MNAKPDQASEAAWDAYRDGPDYTPTDRYPVRQVFDAGYEAGLRASQPTERDDVTSAVPVTAVPSAALEVLRSEYQKSQTGDGSSRVFAAVYDLLVAVVLTNGDNA